MAQKAHGYCVMPYVFLMKASAVPADILGCNMSSTTQARTESAQALARDVLEIEAAAVRALIDRLDARFDQAVQLLLHCKGRVVVSGIGKSGHVGHKIAATLASTGTPAFFVHPAEAAHGDLGMVTGDDVFIAISYSGTASELLTIVPVLKRNGCKLIAMTGNANSELSTHADVHLSIAVEKEACPINLAPTASTTATLALGDALAVATMTARGFGREDFARSHPGGALGRKLLTHVRDVMRSGSAIPTVTLSASVTDAVRETSKKLVGLTAVVHDNGTLAGVFSDGDLRHLIERVGDVRGIAVADVMVAQPITIGPDALAVEAAEMLDRHKRNQLLVVDGTGTLVGVLHTQDLMAAKVI
jgi:arabinose-5-phosphate isomerase